MILANKIKGFLLKNYLIPVLIIVALIGMASGYLAASLFDRKNKDLQRGSKKLFKLTPPLIQATLVVPF